MNVDTGEFRALSDQAASAGQYRRDGALLTRVLAAELSGGDGPLSRDRVVRRLADALMSQAEEIRELTSRVPRPGGSTRPRHLFAVK